MRCDRWAKWESECAPQRRWRELHVEHRPVEAAEEGRTLEPSQTGGAAAEASRGVLVGVGGGGGLGGYGWGGEGG